MVEEIWSIIPSFDVCIASTPLGLPACVQLNTANIPKGVKEIITALNVSYFQIERCGTNIGYVNILVMFIDSKN